MKIAIVSPYPPSKGTLNEYAHHLVAALRHKPEVTEITVLTDFIDESYSDANSDEGCPVILLPCWKFNDPLNFLKINRKLKALDADVVLYNIQFMSFGDNKIAGALGLMAPLVSRVLGTPAITLLHNITELVDYRSAGITNNRLLMKVYDLIGTLLTLLLLMSNALVVTMPKYVRILEKKYKAKNVVLIPHGTFDVPLVPTKQASDGLNVMTFGKFGTYKKVEKMIEAVELVRLRTGMKIDVTIAGTDNPNAKGYLKKVQKEYAHINGVNYTGYVEEEDVPGLFSSSDVVVFPYTSTTGSSGVLHQAGSYSRAVVLPHIGDLKELTEEEGYRGEYFAPDSVAELADAIERLLVDEQYRAEMGAINHAASCGLPMADMADWYLMHMHGLTEASTSSHPQPYTDSRVSSSEALMVG